jgi:O-antigen/teichoic acid export membrane protein
MPKFWTKFTGTKFTESRWVRNTLWMMMSQGLRLVLQATYFITVAQALNPEQYGAFVAVTAFVEILSPFSTLGAGDVLVKQVSRDRTQFSRYWGQALWINLCSALVLTLVLLLVMPLALPKISQELILLGAIASLFCGKAIDLAGKAYQSVGQLKRTAQLHLIPHVLRAIAAIVMVMMVPHPMARDWMWFSVGSLGMAGIAALLMVQLELGAPQWVLGMKRSDLIEGSYFAVGLSAQTIYNDIDKTMLARMATLEATGLYAAAYRLLDMAFVPVRSLMASSYTRFFQSGKTGILGSMQVAKKLLPIMGGYSIVGAIALMSCAPIVPMILGQQYAASVEALQWLAPILLLRSMHYIAADTLAGADLQSHRSAAQIAIALINVGLNFCLIPQFPTAPWKGAMWSSVISDGLLMGLLWSIVFWQCQKQRQQQRRGEILEQMP